MRRVVHTAVACVPKQSGSVPDSAFRLTSMYVADGSSSHSCTGRVPVRRNESKSSAAAPPNAVVAGVAHHQSLHVSPIHD